MEWQEDGRKAFVAFIETTDIPEKAGIPADEVIDGFDEMDLLLDRQLCKDDPETAKRLLPDHLQELYAKVGLSFYLAYAYGKG